MCWQNYINHVVTKHKTVTENEYNEDSVSVVQCGGGRTERDRENAREDEVLIQQGRYKRFCSKEIAGVSVSVGLCVGVYKRWG